jgi:hypothetical protein
MLDRVRNVGQPVVVLVACILALPTHASAAGGSPLHVDPASPVAKAYALPLDGVRTASSGSGHGPGRYGSELFGSGIRRSSERGRSALTRRGSGAPAAAAVLDPGTGSGLAWMAVVAVVVLTLGGTGALALRRRR